MYIILGLFSILMLGIWIGRKTNSNQNRIAELEKQKEDLQDTVKQLETIASSHTVTFQGFPDSNTYAYVPIQTLNMTTDIDTFLSRFGSELPTHDSSNQALDYRDCIVTLSIWVQGKWKDYLNQTTDVWFSDESRWEVYIGKHAFKASQAQYIIQDIHKFMRSPDHRFMYNGTFRDKGPMQFFIEVSKLQLQPEVIKPEVQYVQVKVLKKNDEEDEDRVHRLSAELEVDGDLRKSLSKQGWAIQRSAT